MRRSFLLVLLASCAVAGLLRADEPSPFRTAVVQKTSFTATIKATGTLEPEEVVDIGAQVGGMVKHLGKDAKGKTIDRKSVV